MGRVYLGFDGQGRRVAIKVLHPGSSADTVERFLREAGLLSRLRHPNIVRVHDVDRADGLNFYVMDYIEGPTLESRLRQGPLSLVEARRLGGDLLAALEVVHGIGVVHRDIKPSNIHLLPDRALLGDFGIAHIAEAEPLTAGEAVLGTAGYRAPEQLQRGHVTARADLYAAGITLYEALTGRRWRIIERPGQADWGAVPSDMVRTLTRALAFQPGQRWPSARAFRRALDGRRVRRRRAMRWELGATAAVLALAAALWPEAPRRHVEPVDLALVPFEAESANGAYAELRRFTLQRLEWFPQWSVVGLGLVSASGVRRAGAARAYAGGAFVSSRAGGVFRLSLRDSSGTVFARSTIPGDTTDLAGWSAGIADTIVAHQFPRWLEQYRELGARRGGSVPAYREFFRGEDDFARDAWVDAERHYRRAMELDSTFLQAAWRLTVVRRWARVPFESDLLRLYSSHRDDLPPLHRVLTEAQLTPDIRRRSELYAAATRDFPRSGYAGLLYAEELFHRGALIGVPLDSSVRLLESGSAPGFDRALALDLSLWAYIRLGRREDAWRALRERITTAGPSVEGNGDGDVAAFLRLAYVERFHPALAPVLRWWFLERGNGVPVAQIARILRVAAIFDLPATQMALARTIARRDSSSAGRSTAHEATGLALMMVGRPEAAAPNFDTAAALSGSPQVQLQALQWRVLPAALAWPAGDSLDEWLARTRLERLAKDNAVGNEAAWTLAMAAFARGDTLAARTWQLLVARDTAAGSSAARRAALLMAIGEARTGRYAQALAISEPVVAFDSTGRIGGAFLRSAAHLARGHWWQALGEKERADAEWLWYENSDFVGWPHGEAQAGEVDAVFSVAARRLRASLGHERGNRNAACAGLRRVAELWRDAEPRFIPWSRSADSAARSCTD